MKPDWSTAPDFANYAATDKNGRCFWYEEKPELRIDCWVPAGGDYEECTTVMDWRDTLEERPVHKSSFDYEAEGKENEV
jgi:hypothetical protein